MDRYRNKGKGVSEQMASKEKSIVSMTDMTQGNPYKLILMFSIPLLVGNIFQQLYNMVDSIVVGNFVGDKALAAVGTGFPIIFLMSSLFMGIGTGATVMVSQFYGARDLKRVNDTINTIYTAMIIGVVPLTILGVLLSEPLLRLIRVPDDGTLEMAKIYMIVILIGIIGNLGFNINSGILQGLGDSRTSLIFLLIAAIINTVLDLVFVIVFHWGVMGVALATIIAQVFSWVFGVWFINRRYCEIHIKLLGFHFDKALFKQAMKLGVPSGIQQALFSVGVLVMQSLVNSYGSAFMAGFNGANKIDTFAFMPIQSFTNAVTTYAGQNIGAGNHERVRKGLQAGMILSVGTSILMCLLVYPTSAFMMRMFSQNQEVINAGVAYLHELMPFYALLAISFCFNSVMRGAGEMIVPMISTLFALWLVRVPTAYLLAHFFGGEMMYYSYAIGWVVGIIVSGGYYATGRWKNKSVVKKMDLQETASQSD